MWECRDRNSQATCISPAVSPGVRKHIILKDGDIQAKVDALVAALKKDGYDFSVGIPMDTPIVDAERVVSAAVIPMSLGISAMWVWTRQKRYTAKMKPLRNI